ncbi:MAG: LysM peptidoglycan-binding domain-containing protein [Microbacteriaceae bacterium]|nr:LysM peptidoglycan-binding domain-containing protein [Microbacteriaceae bacterium]
MTTQTMTTHSMVQPRLRLTKRGRAVVSTLGVALVLVLIGVAALVASPQAIASDETVGADFGYVIVQPGASLWQIANEVDPSVDPRDLVAEIVRLNQLQGSDVQAGQPIALPLRYAEVSGVLSAGELGIDV